MEYVMAKNDYVAEKVHRSLDRYQALAATIVAQAAVDFADLVPQVDAIKRRGYPMNAIERHVLDEYKEVVDFFKSDYFSTLTDLDPEVLMARIRKDGVQLVSA